MKIMKTKIITFSFIVLSAQTTFSFQTTGPSTELDKLFFNNSSESVPAYMRENNLNSDQMLVLIDQNINWYIDVAKQYSLPNILGVENSMYAIMHTGCENPFDEIAKYAGEEYPGELRYYTISVHLNQSKLSGLPFASNVVSQAWRSYREIDNVCSIYQRQSKVATPEERDQYSDFFKWVIQTVPLNGMVVSWDSYIIDIDPAWRTNYLRLSSIEYQNQFVNDNIGTNNVAKLLRNYEIAVGLREPDPPLPVKTNSDPIPFDDSDLSIKYNNIMNFDPRIGRKVIDVIKAKPYYLVVKVPIWGIDVIYGMPYNRDSHSIEIKAKEEFVVTPNFITHFKLGRDDSISFVPVVFTNELKGFQILDLDFLLTFNSNDPLGYKIRTNSIHYISLGKNPAQMTEEEVELIFENVFEESKLVGNVWKNFKAPNFTNKFKRPVGYYKPHLFAEPENTEAETITELENYKLKPRHVNLLWLLTLPIVAIILLLFRYKRK